jgi:hypothetical protein
MIRPKTISLFIAFTGPPITYLLDGKQYVALMGGVGEVTGGNAGPGNAATPFPPKLLVFALDGKAPLPK